MEEEYQKVKNYNIISLEEISQELNLMKIKNRSLSLNENFLMKKFVPKLK